MARDKRPTVADVAARAGVSIGTVSNVLNGVVPVSARTRSKVLDVISELDYRQNMLAQGLRSKRAPIFGVCVPHTAIAYFSELANAFEAVASNNNFQIMQVLSHKSSELEFQRVKALLNYRVAGLILVPTMEPDETYRLVAESAIPAVIVDRAPTSSAFPFDRVTFDNRAAMRAAGGGLIQRGHRNILFLVHQRQLNVTQQRIAGLEEAAAASPDKVVTQVREVADASALTALLAVEMSRKDRPTALVVSNSAIATWVFRAMRLIGVECPRDVSIIAFDEPEWADIVTPSLSVVRQPTREIAVMAWRFLMQRIANEATGVQEVQLEAEVLFRDSVRDLNAAG